MGGASDVARGGIHETRTSGQLILRLLGDFAAEVDGREISLATRKAKALMAYLALSDSGMEDEAQNNAVARYNMLYSFAQQ